MPIRTTKNLLVRVYFVIVLSFSMLPGKWVHNQFDKHTIKIHIIRHLQPRTIPVVLCSASTELVNRLNIQNRMIVTCRYMSIQKKKRNIQKLKSNQNKNVEKSNFSYGYFIVFD